MEGQDAGVDTEQRVPAQHFDVPVLEVEGIVGDCGRGVDGGLVVGGICNGEVGQRRDTDGWRLIDWRRGDGVWLWGRDGFERRWMKNVGLGVSLGEPQGCGNGSCGGILLVLGGWLRSPGFEFWRRRKAFPPAFV